MVEVGGSGFVVAEEDAGMEIGERVAACVGKGCRTVDMELGSMGFGSRGRRATVVDTEIVGMDLRGKVENFGFGSTGVVWRVLCVGFVGWDSGLWRRLR